jgi:hypothetical protein
MIGRVTRIKASELGKRKLPKEKSLSKLKKELTVVFNAFIRKRDTLPNGTFKCISSGKILPVSQMNAGHYHSAGHNEAIRWDERNVNGQSIQDNLFLHGNFGGYTKGMLEKYGQKVIDELDIKRHNKSKMARFEVSYLIQEYKKKLKE